MTATTRLPQLNLPSPYVAYAYSYPHKTAYQQLRPARSIKHLWNSERKDQLFLYIHIPFCEMRCGFCNLFTTANPRQTIVKQYLRAFATQARVVREALGDGARFARMAIGGGTPTYLEADDLHAVLSIAEKEFAISPGSIPMSVETSPRTATSERLGVLKSFGVTRISMGVQSFVDSEVAASGRAQTDDWVKKAIRLIREFDFPTLNLDLIYGLPSQTVDSWIYSLQAALQWRPEELYLYPLYVRPLTGLDRRGASAHDHLRLECYRRGRDLLLSSGYRQISMRFFQREDHPDKHQSINYCCQDDGMIGLGSGARSYTRSLHYSNEFAVGSSGVREIIGSYLERSARQMGYADYGCELNAAEQKRRWVIKSLFRMPGLDRKKYHAVFNTDATEDFPELLSMIEDNYFNYSDGFIEPASLGLEWSDALAPALFSATMLQRSDKFELR